MANDAKSKKNPAAVALGRPGGYIRIRAEKVSKGRLSRFFRRIRAERGERCERCGRDDKNAQVHHFLEVHVYPMFAFEPDNVAVLCQECHVLATQVQRVMPNFDKEFYSAFSAEKQKRLAEFRKRMEKILAKNYPAPQSNEKG